MSTSKNIYKKYSATNKTLLSANIYMIRPRVCIQKRLRLYNAFPTEGSKPKGQTIKQTKKNHMSL